eukprot:5868838-Pleurochrysis_carterae.AAC.1
MAAPWVCGVSPSAGAPPLRSASGPSPGPAAVEWLCPPRAPAPASPTSARRWADGRLALARASREPPHPAASPPHPPGSAPGSWRGAPLPGHPRPPTA